MDLVKLDELTYIKKSAIDFLGLEPSGYVSVYVVYVNGAKHIINKTIYEDLRRMIEGDPLDFDMD